MGKNGGQRPGAGRPVGALSKTTLTKLAAQQKADEIARELLMPQWGAIIDAQAQHAQGVSYMVLRAPDGSFVRATDEKQIDAACAAGELAFKIYTQAPNTQAFTALRDTAFDKPIERHQVTGADGGPLLVKWQE